MPARPSKLSDPVVTFVTSEGVVEVQLMPALAPVTVANFLGYVGSGFYDGVIFHRLYKPSGSGPGIVAQAGLLATSGSGSYQIRQPAAPIVLESQNGLSNTLGTLAMARATEPDSGAAQFYFNTSNNAADFDYQSAASPGYAVFGSTLRGLDVLGRISQTPTQTVSAGSLGVLTDFPTEDVVIEAARSTQYFALKRADYTLAASGAEITVTPRKGGAGVSVAAIDRLQFKDVSLGINELMAGVLATSAVLGVATADGQSLLAPATRDELMSAGYDGVTLDGGAGNDTLSGGAGNDLFAFSTALGKTNVDTINNLVPGQDRLLLDVGVTCHVSSGHSFLENGPRISL